MGTREMIEDDRWHPRRALEPQDGDHSDSYTFATGSKVEIVSADPAATARWLREIEIESDREFLLPPFTD